MALIVFKDGIELQPLLTIEEIDRIKSYESKYEVQYLYCTAIEMERAIGVELLFDDPNVKEYLEGYGVRYVGNYLLESEEWGIGEDARQFVTYLNPCLQLACLILHYPERIHLLTKDTLINDIFMTPILKKTDVYLQLKSYENMWFLEDFISQGIEVRIAGQSLKDITDESRKCDEQ